MIYELNLIETGLVTHIQYRPVNMPLLLWVKKT